MLQWESCSSDEEIRKWFKGQYYFSWILDQYESEKATSLEEKKIFFTTTMH